MQPLPHYYQAHAHARHDGSVRLEAEGLRPIESAAAAQFDGPGDLWSPETMLAAAVAGCFVLTFRTVAHAASFPWVSLECSAQGRLERNAGIVRFTEFMLRPALTVPPNSDHDRAIRLLEKAQRNGLIASSLQVAIRLDPAVIEAPAGRLSQIR